MPETRTPHLPIGADSQFTAPMRNRTLASIALGGGVAGVLDITYAILFYKLRSGVAPIRILQSVASGWLGKEAYQGGVNAAALGLATHFFIAFTAAAVYVLASGRFAILARRPFAFGAAYGVAIYLVMNQVVIPLSRISRRPPFDPLVVSLGLLVHVLFIGIPIALAARRARAAR